MATVPLSADDCDLLGQILEEDAAASADLADDVNLPKRERAVWGERQDAAARLACVFRAAAGRDRAPLTYGVPRIADAPGPVDTFPADHPSRFADPAWPAGYVCPDCHGTRVHADSCPVVLARLRRPT